MPSKLRRAEWQWAKSKAARRIFSLCRFLHIYISTALFSLLILFSFTGVTLNHPQWLSATDSQDILTLALPASLTIAWAQNQEVQLDALLAYVEKQTGLAKARTIEQDEERGELSLDYPLPAGYAFVSVFLEENKMEVEYETGNTWALINDLHKGRHTGQLWSWLIDISAVLMIVFALTGFVILLQQVRHRIAGLWFMCAGTLLPILIYIFYVPALRL